MVVSSADWSRHGGSTRCVVEAIVAADRCCLRPCALAASRPRPTSRPSRSASRSTAPSPISKRQQNNNGTWPDHPGFDGGMHGAVHVGAAERRRRAAKTKRSRSRSTYLRTLAADADLRRLAADDGLLRRRAQERPAADSANWPSGSKTHQITSGDGKGAWSYPLAGRGRRRRVEQPVRAAGAVRGRTRRRQGQRANLAAGAAVLAAAAEPRRLVGLLAGSAGTGSMTCAGITSLIIAAGELNRGDADGRRRPGALLRRTTDERGDRKRTRAGWTATSRSTSNPSGRGGRGAQGNLLYYLYGVERAGRMTARRFIGQHDWYREGADMLVRNQDQLSGFWKGTGHAETESARSAPASRCCSWPRGAGRCWWPSSSTARGDDWNHHRSDLANLTSYVEKRWQRDLTWQVIDPAAASVEDLLQAPVLFINGREAPRVHRPSKRSACASTSTAAASSSPRPAAAATSSTPAFAS